MADNTRYDLEGYEAVTKALWDLLDSFPAMGTETFYFAEIDADKGKAFIPVSGAIIQREVSDVTCHVEQTCIYPFMVTYKAAGLSENNKVKVKEWLDNLGRWLERQPVVIDSQEYQLTEYPTLTQGREFEKIERTSPSYLSEINEDNVETWAITIQATYRNEFDY